MESFTIFGVLVAIFLQFIQPQLCKEIKGFEIVHKGKDGLVDSRIDINFITNQPIEGDMSLPKNKIKSTCIESFCENVPDYPLDMINNAAKDISSTAFGGLQGNVIEIANRQSSEGFTGLCDKRVRTVFPQRGRNINNKNVFIVNHPGKEQGVVVTICRNDTISGCGKANIVDNYTGGCTQLHSKVYLIAYDPEIPNEVSPQGFFLPSCCVCTLKQLY